MTVHDLDVRRWALKAQDEVSLSPDLFQVSKKWLNSFKKEHKIVSKKINKFITQKSIVEKDKLEKEAVDFVNNVKTIITQVGEENVFNSDQSGFNLEMHTGRTLSFKG